MDRMEQYKSRGRAKESQRKRRERMLLAQQSRRKRQFDLARGIIVEDHDEPQQMGDAEDDDHLQQQQHQEEEMDAGMDAQQDSTSEAEKSSKKKKKYAHQLMMGEILETIPEDITENWSCVVCPKGQRCLIVSHNGYTQAFNKHGDSIMKFNSLLPGGGRTPESYRGSSVLDGIFDKEQFYILDIIYWHGMHILDSPFDFRSFWLESKWAERQDISQAAKTNPFPMIALPRLPCDNTQIREYLATIPNQDEIDGLGLFHNNSIYESGENPLALWVDASRIDEVLGE